MQPSHINIVIVEDEPPAARHLSNLIAQVRPTVSILAVLGSLQRARQWFSEPQNKPDLVFMDIQLGDGMSFDLFATHPLSCPVVFTTAYNEYAIKAFKVNSIDYLLKPVDKAELAQAFNKFDNLFNKPQPDWKAQMENLLLQLKPNVSQPFRERFTAHQGSSLVVVQVAQVACFVREEIIYLHTIDNQKLVTDFTSLDDLEQVLDPKLFFRANRQVLVHIAAIKTIRPLLNGKLEVGLRPPVAIKIDISREKATEFKAWVG